MQTVANGTASHKEISWDDMIDGNLPPHEPTVAEQHLDFFRQAVSQAAATMDNPPYNDQKGKLMKAMDLVLEGKVTQQDGLWTVQGSTRPLQCQRRVSLPARPACGVQMVQASGSRRTVEAGAGAAVCRKWQRQRPPYFP